MNIDFSSLQSGLNYTPYRSRPMRDDSIRAGLNAKARDGRALKPKELESLRRMVVAAHSIGLTHRQVCDTVGLSYSAVRNIIRRYEAQGEASLQVAKRGNKLGRGRSLSPLQEQRMKVLIQGHQPQELGLPFTRWTSRAAGALLQRECHVDICSRSVRNYMTRWGMNAKAQGAGPRTAMPALSAPASRPLSQALN